MRLYDEDEKLNSNYSSDWQNKFLDWVIIRYTSFRWRLYKLISIFTQPF
jgi:hypothetical protein